MSRININHNHTSISFLFGSILLLVLAVLSLIVVVFFLVLFILCFIAICYIYLYEIFSKITFISGLVSVYLLVPFACGVLHYSLTRYNGMSSRLDRLPFMHIERFIIRNHCFSRFIEIKNIGKL